ncbi:MAG: hypothetical protein K8R45_11445 [Desulfobacterales bacterium]|nr:hypothetical protein [Desulfobacterales bacterium]
MEDTNGSRELSRKFDIVLEMEKTLDEMDKAFDLEDIDAVSELISFIRFLVKDLDDIFSGEYENLRYREFVFRRKGGN